MRVVFLGSPEFALPSLRRLIESHHEIVAVYTQPDRPSGRGRKLSPPPVKEFALEHGLEVRQPVRISRADEVETLRSLGPDLGVITAYGQILKQPVLDAFPLGVLNVHASLLPRWRGAAPIPAAILAGDTETGATIMRVVLALDAGPMLASARVPIGDDDTTATLTPTVAEAGAALLRDVLPAWERGEILAVEQDDAFATYAPQIAKDDALLDLERDDARTAWRKVRAYNPWPVAFAYLDGEPVRILEARPLETSGITAAPGTIVAPAAGDPASVVCANRTLLGLTTVQPTGRRQMPADAWLRGRSDVAGRRLTATR